MPNPPTRRDREMQSGVIGDGRRDEWKADCGWRKWQPHAGLGRSHGFDASSMSNSTTNLPTDVVVPTGIVLPNQHSTELDEHSKESTNNSASPR